MLGVTVFFVLSGYLITSLLLVEWDNTKTIDLKNFWLRRVRRLFPAIALVIIVCMALFVIFDHELLTKLRRDLLPALLWFTNWWYVFADISYFEAIGAPSPVTHFWSLAIEEQFYVVWPLLLLALGKAGVGKTAQRRTTIALAAVSAILMAVLYNPTADPSRVYYGTDTRAFSLLAGAWLAYVWPAYQLNERSGSRMARKELALLDAVGIVAFVGLLCMVVFVDDYSPLLYRGGLVLASILTATVIAVIVHPRSMFGRALGLTPFVWIGKRSYGMYLWHYPILLLMNPRNSTADPNPLYLLLQLGIIMGVSALSYHFVENPHPQRKARGVLQRRARRQRESAPLATAACCSRRCVRARMRRCLRRLRGRSEHVRFERPERSHAAGRTADPSPGATARGGRGTMEVRPAHDRRLRVPSSDRRLQRPVAWRPFGRCDEPTAHRRPGSLPIL